VPAGKGPDIRAPLAEALPGTGEEFCAGGGGNSLFPVPTLLRCIPLPNALPRLADKQSRARLVPEVKPPS